MADGGSGSFLELAQADTAGDAIGRVETVIGRVSITRVDGTAVTAENGTPIFPGDLIETAFDGKVGVLFADQSTFSLAEHGKMTIDEMVYDPEAQTGNSVVSIAEGIFSFASGQLAKVSPDAMVLKTPMSTIGIRGTTGAGKAGPEGTTNTFALLPDAGGTVGEAVVQTATGISVLNQAYQVTQVTSLYTPPTPPVVLPPAVLARAFAAATTARPPAPESRPQGDGEQSQSGGEGAEDGGPDDDGPTGDGPTGEQDGPTGGEAGPEGPEVALGPEGFGPAGPGGPADGGPQAAGGQLERVVTQAFDQMMAAGDFDAAISAATTMATVGASLGEQALSALAQMFDGPAGPGGPGGPGAFGPGDFTAALQQAVETAFAGGFGGPGGPGGPEGPGPGGPGPFGPGPGDFGFGPGGPGNFGPDAFGPGTFGPGPGDFGPVGPSPFGPDADLFGFGPEAIGFVGDGFEFFAAQEVFFAGFNDFDVLVAGDVSIADTEDGTFIGFDDTAPLTTSFDSVIDSFTTSNDTVSGGGVNTNFYMTNALIGGSDTVTGAGGVTNQLSFDDLEDKQFFLNASSSVDGSISISQFSTSTSLGSISYANVQQFLFADGPQSGFGTEFQSSVDDTQDSQLSDAESSDAPATEFNTDVVVFPALLAGESGLVVAGTSSDDNITLGGGIDGALAFGKGGGDTIDVQFVGDALLIGGITSTDNQDTDFDSIPDSGVNVFRYDSTSLAGLSVTDGTIGVVGLSAFLVGVNAEPGGDGLVKDRSSFAELFNNLWDVGSFHASQGPDQIAATGGNYATIDGSAGNDGISIDGGTKVANLLGGIGADSLTINGASQVTSLDAGADDDQINIGGGSTVSNLNGGAGTNDSIQFTSGGGTISNVTGIESIAGFDGNETVTLADGGNAIGIQGTIGSITGGSGTDILNLSSSGATLTNVSLIEQIHAGTVIASHSVTLANTAGESVTVTGDFEAFTGGGGNDEVTFGTAGGTLDSVTGVESFVGGSGTDSVALADAGVAVAVSGSIETLTGSSGADHVTVADADIVGVTWDGGASTDLLTLTAPSVVTLGATDLAGIVGFEVWELASAQAYTLTLNDNNIAASTALSVDASSAAFATVDASLETDGRLNFTGSTGGDSITLNAGMIEGGAPALAGGGGTDTLTLNAIAAVNLDATELAGVTGFETWTMGSDQTYTLALSNTNVAGSNTLTITGAGLSSGNALVVDGTAETGGSLSITGGAGNDTLTGGDGTDTLVGGSGADILSGGAGADTLTGGAGADVLTGGGGADVFRYTATSEGSDTISDFLSATDVLNFLDSAFGGLGVGGYDTVSQAFTTDVNTTITTLAGLADSELYKVDLDGFNPGTDLGTLENAMTTSGSHAGAALFAVSDGTDTRIYYDADTAAGIDGSGMTEIATLSGIGDADAGLASADFQAV